MDLRLLEGLLPYQQAWLKDTSQFKFGLWARQTGKDYTCAAEAAYHCALHADQHWLIVACGERQARESLLKAKDWGARITAKARELKMDACAEIKRECSTEILFTNGSRITALPARPSTVRGYSANLILTEFAFHDHAESIWQAIFPSVSNSLRGGAKCLHIISTPNGQGNFFHNLWLDSKIFSRHPLTIHQARQQGLEIDIPTLKAGIMNPDSWAQEYECQFLDQTSVLLPYDLITPCESPEATEHSSPETLSSCRGELFVGIDFGRKNDLTVCWVLERLGDELWTREVLTLARTPTPAQVEALRPRVQRARRVCVDYTGAGIGLGDELAREFSVAGDANACGKIELCHFTVAFKEEIFVKLRARLERRNLFIPPTSEIREDLHAMHRIVSANGHISFRASHSSDGHSDRCTALALALRAAESLVPTAPASTVGPRFRGTRSRRFR